MLVLSRAKNEAILIGGSILVTILELRPDKVRLEIKSAETTTVRREQDGQLQDLLPEAARSDGAVLWRKRDESVVIGDSITITVVDIRPGYDKVRLGLQVPREMSVHRKEVYDAIQPNHPE